MVWSLLALITFSGCNSGSGGGLSSQLAGHTFTVEGFDNNLGDCNLISPDSSNQSALSPEVQAPSSGSDTSDPTIVFSSTTFNYLENGATLYSGTWKAIDNNTVQLTIDGETVDVDVEVNGNSITVLDVDASCSNGSGNTPGIADPIEDNPDTENHPSDTSAGTSNPSSGDDPSDNSTILDD